MKPVNRPSGYNRESTTVIMPGGQLARVQFNKTSKRVSWNGGKFGYFTGKLSADKKYFVPFDPKDSYKIASHFWRQRKPTLKNGVYVKSLHKVG